MKPEIVEIQSWRYKTIAVMKRQQQTTISNKQVNFIPFSFRMFFCESQLKMKLYVFL